MLVDKYERYRFEPPIDVGENNVTSLARLLAFALGGPDVNQILLDAITEQAHAGLECAAEYTPRLYIMNKLLAGKHIAREL